MMLAGGPYSVPFVYEAMEAGWQGDYVGAAHCAPLAGTYFNMRKTTIYGGSNEVQRNIIAQSGLGLKELNMDFDFTEDQESLRDAVRRWVDKGYDFERRRGIVKAGGFSREAWGELTELGLPGLAIPEAHGGMGFGAVEAMVVMEELGRGLVLEPFAAVSLVAAPMLGGSDAPRRRCGCRASPTAVR